MVADFYLAIGPVGHVVDGSFHAGVVARDEAHVTRFGPEVAFAGRVMNLAFLQRKQRRYGPFQTGHEIKTGKSMTTSN